MGVHGTPTQGGQPQRLAPFPQEKETEAQGR